MRGSRKSGPASRKDNNDNGTNRVHSLELQQAVWGLQGTAGGKGCEELKPEAPVAMASGPLHSGLHLIQLRRLQLPWTTPIQVLFYVNDNNG